MRALKSHADKIAEGGANACCLREENLFTAEHQPGHTWVRRCRVCGSRHVRMKAEPISLAAVFAGSTMTRRRASGARDIRMQAQSGGYAGRIVAPGRDLPPQPDAGQIVRYLDI